MITLSFDTWEEYDSSVADIASLVIALGTDNPVSQDPPSMKPTAKEAE